MNIESDIIVTVWQVGNAESNLVFITFVTSFVSHNINEIQWYEEIIQIPMENHVNSEFSHQ